MPRWCCQLRPLCHRVAEEQQVGNPERANNGKGRILCLLLIKENTNPWFVKELESGYVVIGGHQHFKGYTLFLCKEHKTELFQLNYATKMKYLEEMSVVAEAVAKAFGAEKMNYEL